jgi:hypothetical protein
MILQNSKLPKSKYLSEQILKEFSEKHSGKKIVTLVWSNKPGEITRQIEYALDNKVDIILSEVLPDEVGFEMNHEMYEFFLRKYIFVPPILNNSDRQSLTNSKKKSYIFTDKTIKREDRFSSIIQYLNRTDLFEIIDISELRDFVTELSNYVSVSNHVIINACSPQDILAVVLISLTQSKRFTILSETAYSPFRYSVFGINITNFLPVETSSLRYKIQGILGSEKVDTNLLPDCFRKAIDLTTKPEFNSLHEIVFSEPFKTLDQLYKTQVNDTLWKRPHMPAGLLKNNEYLRPNLNSDHNIFKRKTYHCLSKLLSKDNLKDNVRGLYIKIESFVFKDHATELLNSRSNYLWHKEVIECVNLYTNWFTRLCDFAIYQTNKSIFHKSVLRNLEEFILWAMLNGMDDSNTDIEKEIYTNYDKILNARIKIESGYNKVGVAKRKLLQNNEEGLMLFSDNEYKIIEIISTFDVITRSSENDKFIIEALDALNIKNLAYKYKLFERILASLLDRYHGDIISFSCSDDAFGGGNYDDLLVLIEKNLNHPQFPEFATLIICVNKQKKDQNIDSLIIDKLENLACTFHNCSLLLNKTIDYSIVKIESLINSPNQISIIELYLTSLFVGDFDNSQLLCDIINDKFHHSSIIENPQFFQNFYFYFHILDCKATHDTVRSNLFSCYSDIFDTFCETTKEKVATVLGSKFSTKRKLAIPSFLNL